MVKAMTKIKMTRRSQRIGGAGDNLAEGSSEYRRLTQAAHTCERIWRKIAPKTMKNVLNRFNESGRDHHIKESRSTPYKDKKSNDMTELAPFGTCSIAGYPERWRFARGRPHQLCLQGYSQFLQKSKAAFFPLRSCDPQPILNF